MKSKLNVVSNYIAIAYRKNKLTDQFSSIARPVLYFIMITGTLLFTACKKYDRAEQGNNSQLAKANVDKELLTFYKGLAPETLFELQQARAATARYRNVKNAFDDQYVDIGLKLPNMGYHFLKSQLVSPTFDIKRPPILVYNKNDDGNFELLAVEYAVPIDPQTPNVPPVGFFGDDDEWDFNTLNTGWWTLHAWVWKNNPDGVFEPMNPLVEVK